MSKTRKLLLSLLTDAGERGVTTAECLQAGVGSRYGARLLELREEGYVIESRRERVGSFRYVLVDTPEDTTGAPSPSLPPLKAPDPPGLFSEPSAGPVPHWAVDREEAA